MQMDQVIQLVDHLGQTVMLHVAQTNVVILTYFAQLHRLVQPAVYHVSVLMHVREP